MNLTQLFDLSLQGRRDVVGLEFQGVSLTFGEIDSRANRAAQWLKSRGFEKGDRLCVYLVNRLEVIDLYLGCTRCGVIFVPVNILYREREIAHIVHDSGPKLIVSESVLAGFESVSCTAAEFAREAAGMPDERPAVLLDGDDAAGIVYTSGTTGVSKGAILTHNNFASNAVNITTCWRISEADRFLLALPLFHVHALGNGLHAWLLSGCRMRLLERFEQQKTRSEFEDFRPTLFFGVPTMYVRMLEWPAESARGVRLFVSGSAPLPAAVLEDFRARFGSTILERYGMTETFMNLSNPYEGERRAGKVGMPLPGVSARIVDGELQVKGPNVFAGYWGREEATRAAFADGWFRTGDLAEQSEDGYYTLKGRKSDLIISGGFNIYPREIEELLLEQDGVKEAAVVGVEDRARGEVPVAYIVISRYLDIIELEKVCREKLASFKTPRAFVVVESLPRTALGKVQKHLLPKPPMG
jgi:malonyl-CoA/methylmalonyl-CoA synthetase